MVIRWPFRVVEFSPVFTFERWNAGYKWKTHLTFPTTFSKVAWNTVAFCPQRRINNSHLFSWISWRHCGSLRPAPSKDGDRWVLKVLIRSYVLIKTGYESYKKSRIANSSEWNHQWNDMYCCLKDLSCRRAAEQSERTGRVSQFWGTGCRQPLNTTVKRDYF